MSSKETLISSKKQVTLLGIGSNMKDLGLQLHFAKTTFKDNLDALSIGYKAPDIHCQCKLDG